MMTANISAEQRLLWSHRDAAITNDQVKTEMNNFETASINESSKKFHSPKGEALLLKIKDELSDSD